MPVSESLLIYLITKRSALLKIQSILRTTKLRENWIVLCPKITPLTPFFPLFPYNCNFYVTQAVWRYPEILAVDKLYTNDMHAVANTYGIEAVVKVIRKVYV